MVFLVACQLGGKCLHSQMSQLDLPPVKEVYTDQLGQLYLLLPDGQLSRKDIAGDSTYTFFDNLLGEITSLDLSDPFSPMVYYQDYQTIVLLDRTLSETGRMDLRENEYLGLAGVFRRSFDDRVWVYDEWDFRLKLFNAQGELLQQSDDLRRSINLLDSPHSIYVRGNNLLLLIPERGLARFSAVGQFLGWDALPNANVYQWSQEGLIAWDNSSAWEWKGRKAQNIQLAGLAFPFDQLHPFQTGWLIRKGHDVFYLK